VPRICEEFKGTGFAAFGKCHLDSEIGNILRARLAPEALNVEVFAI